MHSARSQFSFCVLKWYEDQLIPVQWEPDWNNTKMHQSKLFLLWPLAVLLDMRCVLCGVECPSRLYSVSREWQRTDLGRQEETETTEGIETQLDTQTCMSRSTHARARWTCTHSQMAHTTKRQWLRCCSCPHVHILWSGASELMQGWRKL